jgi:phytoene synthase
LVSNTAKSTTPDADVSAVAAAARSGEPDRYLAALLAPPQHRQALLALAAFSAELARIPLLVVHEPAMGEIRLQWWRDALEMPAALRAGHPVADAVRAAAQTYELPADLLEALIEARSCQLRPDPPASELELRDLLWKTDGSLFALAGRVVGLAGSAEVEAGCAASGYAYGCVQLLMGLPRALSLGRIPLAETQLEPAGLSAQILLSGAGEANIERLIANYSAQIRLGLATARQFTAKLPRAARVAFLPLALVEPYLRSIERSGAAFLREGASLAPLTRVCRVAAAHLLGRP